MPFLVLLLTILLCACGVHDAPVRAPSLPTVSVLVDPSFTVVDRVEVLNAVLEWRRALAPAVNITMVATAPADVVIRTALASETGEEFDDEGKSDGFILGIVDDISGHVVTINTNYPRLSGVSVRQITLHELGHIFGARHRNNTLMHPGNGSSMLSCIDETTLDQVSAARSWKGLVPSCI